MSDDPKIVGFPKAEVSPEEMVRRQRVEAERLARLSPGEWQLWIDNSAAQLGMPRATLEASVKAIIAQREKDERERKAEAERAEKAAMRQRREQAKKKQQEFKVLAELPEREQEAPSRWSGETPGGRPCGGARGIRAVHLFARPRERRAVAGSGRDGGAVSGADQANSGASLCSGRTPTPPRSRCGSCLRGYMPSRCILPTWSRRRPSRIAARARCSACSPG